MVSTLVCLTVTLVRESPVTFGKLTSVPDTILNTPPSSFDQSPSIVPPSRCCRPRTRKQAPLARRRLAPARYTQDGARGFVQHAHARHACLLLQLRCLLLPSHSICSEAAGQHAGTRCTFPRVVCWCALLAPSRCGGECCGRTCSLLCLGALLLQYAGSLFCWVSSWRRGVFRVCRCLRTACGSSGQVRGCCCSCSRECAIPGSVSDGRRRRGAARR